MKKTLTNKIAQLTLALALTFGGSLTAQANTLPETFFGQSPTSIFTQHPTAKPLNLEGIPEVLSIVTDTQMDLLFGEPVDLVKYSFLQNMLFQVELDFNKCDLEAFKNLYLNIALIYGEGQFSQENTAQNHLKQKYKWDLEDRIIVLYRLDFGSYQNISLDVIAKRPDIAVL